MRPGILVILDGFGFGEPDHPCNAVALADTPTLDRLRANNPLVDIANNQHHVGLPAGQMGNSEVGHLNIGAGRVVYQDFLRINKAIEDGTYATNEALQQAFEHVKAKKSRLHLIGLLGPGGVHAHESHFAAALQAAAAAGIGDVYVHPIGDGRDTAPRSAPEFLATLQQQIEAAGVGRIADLVGRYYAMDRDQRWERVQHAYDLYRRRKGRQAQSIEHALDQCHDADEDDEFWGATVLDEDGGIRGGDAVVWLNFRPDRSRQMTRAFKQPDFDGFDRGHAPDILWVCTTQYDDEFPTWPGVKVAFPPQRPTDTLGEHVSRLGLRQLRISETEKYAHVTYFLNGGREEPFPGEDRILVPSPKVATYYLQPEMSAGDVTDHILESIGSGGHDLIVVNYPNGDMVGHTGNLEAGIQAVEFLDNCLDRVVRTAEACGFVGLITSDHGNCEEMCTRAPDGGRGDRLTQHSMLPSPLIAFGQDLDIRLEEGGALSNVAPTLLDLMGVDVPAAMTQPSLVHWLTKPSVAKAN